MKRMSLYIGWFLVSAGVLLALLPERWFERATGFEPDGGDGSMELLIPGAFFGVGIALLAIALVTVRWRREVATSHVSGSRT